MPFKLTRSIIAPLLAGAAMTASASGAETVTFAWPGNMSSGYAPFTFAERLGYFEDEDIVIDTILLQGAGTIMPQIVNGGVTTGFITLNPLIVARQPGNPDFDVVYTYNMVRKSIWEIVVLEDSPVQTLKDLESKSIGVGGLSFGNVPMTLALLQQEGVAPEDVNLVPVGLGAPAFEALRSGEVDALNLYEIMNVMLEQQGTDIRRLQLPEQYSAVSSYGLPFRTQTVEEQPELVAGFGRALAKGTVACMANLEACLMTYWDEYPAQKPVPLTDEAVEKELQILTARLSNMISSVDENDLGAFTDNDWLTTIKALHEGEQIENADLDLSRLYTNQFVEAYNDFARDEVVAAAKAFAN